MELLITSLYLVAWSAYQCSGQETWLAYRNYKYHISKNDRIFGSAEMECSKLDSDAILASIKSEDIQMFLLNNLQSSTSEYFLGAHKKTGPTISIQPKHFYWLDDGTSFDYNNFLFPEPDNDPNPAECVVLHASDGRWKTESCSLHSKRYICQRYIANSPTTKIFSTTASRISTTTSETIADGNVGSLDTGLIAGAAAGGVIVILLVIGGFLYWFKIRNPPTSEKKKELACDNVIGFNNNTDEVHNEGNVPPVANYEIVDGFQKNQTNIKSKSSLYDDDNKKTEKPHSYETVQVDTSNNVIIHSDSCKEVDDTYNFANIDDDEAYNSELENEENTDNTYSHLNANSNEKNTGNTYSHLNTNSNEENTDNTYSHLNTNKKEEKDLYNSLQNH